MLLAQYRLAAFFRRPVSELNITFDEFCHWQAYLELEPPDEAENYRTALLAERITNMAGKSMKKPVKLDDFLGKKEAPKRQTMEEQKAFFRSLRGE